MMHTAAEALVNTDGMNAIVLTFFTALFGMVGTVVIAVLKQRSDVRETKESSLSTARLVERKLDILVRNHDRLDAQIDDLSKAVRDHMEYHLLEESKRHVGEQQRTARLFGRQ